MKEIIQRLAQLVCACANYGVLPERYMVRGDDVLVELLPGVKLRLRYDARKTPLSPELCVEDLTTSVIPKRLKPYIEKEITELQQLYNEQLDILAERNSSVEAILAQNRIELAAKIDEKLERLIGKDNG